METKECSCDCCKYADAKIHVVSQIQARVYEQLKAEPTTTTNDWVEATFIARFLTILISDNGGPKLRLLLANAPSVATQELVKFCVETLEHFMKGTPYASRYADAQGLCSSKTPPESLGH